MNFAKLWLCLLSVCLCAAAPPPGAGALQGKVTLERSGEALHHVRITLGRTGRITQSGEDGSYLMDGLTPGSYTVTAHLSGLGDVTQTVVIAADQTATADFSLRLDAVKESLTVTASGSEQTTFESVSTVTSLDAIDVALNSQPSLGEMLNNQPGVAKRSFGPGSSRPVIRGFDGDRVLIMQDGLSTGTLSSQSGDHGETIDPSSLERIEVVKGPGTLLYGSNAIGGVVNAVSGRFNPDEHPHTGLRGFFTGFGGSNNGQGGGAAGFDASAGIVSFFGGVSGQRTGDYSTPLGKVENSSTKLFSGNFGGGINTKRFFFTLGYSGDDNRYGVPAGAHVHHEDEDHEHEGEEHEDEEDHDDHDHGHEAERVDLTLRRHTTRFAAGVRDPGAGLSQIRFDISYNDYQHQELANDEVETTFLNKLTSYRTTFTQKRKGALSGSFGFSGLHRTYETIGAEALAPPVTQNGFAAFAVEELDYERVRFQFGGRVENNRYSPDGLRDRSFTGFSGGAGVFVPLWKQGAFVANYTSSYRAPALEELYNEGPHPGTLTYEIGNADLVRERSNGVDFSLRHQGTRLRGDVNYFYYRISNFVYLAPTGEIDDGLPVAHHSQASSRFTGVEASLDAALTPSLWLNLGLDSVNAKLTETSQPLPRIPPVRGRVGFDWRWKGLSVKPQLQLAAQQDRLFANETRTAGYAVVNLAANYSIPQQHFVHVFGVNVFNAADRLYYNHLSFIKQLAPEIGRGVRFTYTVRFF